MSNQQEKELDVLIRARYPLIYLVSWEEQRAQSMLTELAHAQGKGLYLWSLTRGMCDAQGACDASVKEPQNALDYIHKSEARALFVLKDFHSHMQDPAVIRRLRDLVQDLKP